MKNEKQKNLTGTVYGFDFYVDAESFKFVVPALEKKFDGYTAMCESIERQEKELKRAATRRIKVPVFDDKGREFNVTGFHSGNGALLTDGKKLERFESREWVVPIAAKALYEQASRHWEECKSAARRAENAMHRICVDVTSEYGFDPSKHEARVAKFEADVAAAELVAESMSLDKLLAMVSDEYEFRKGFGIRL